MKSGLRITTIACSAGVIIALFIGLAQTQILFLPYFTPAKIEFQGLQQQYPVNGSMAYTISLKGYGSNCLGFTAETLRKIGSLTDEEERVSYFSKTDDCRKINISEGAYNYSQSFSYNGPVVLGRPGEYRVKVAVLDEITRQNYTDTRAFMVK
jgi:hypothetical protein